MNRYKTSWLHQIEASFYVQQGPTPARTVLKSFVAMFIGSARFGMNLENTTARSSALQKQLAEELIEVMGSRAIEPDDKIWYNDEQGNT